MINAVLSRHTNLHYYQVCHSVTLVYGLCPASLQLKQTGCCCLSVKTDGSFSITNGLGLFLQGYHDVASVLLLLMGENNAYMMLEKLSLYHLKYPSFFDPIYILLFPRYPYASVHMFLNVLVRGCMAPSLDEILGLLALLFPLMAHFDVELHEFLCSSGVEPFFALSWVLTWFSHDVDRWSVVARLFDSLLACHPAFSLYLSAAVQWPLSQNNKQLFVKPLLSQDREWTTDVGGTGGDNSPGGCSQH